LSSCPRHLYRDDTCSARCYLFLRIYPQELYMCSLHVRPDDVWPNKVLDRTEPESGLKILIVVRSALEEKTCLPILYMYIISIVTCRGPLTCVNPERTPIVQDNECSGQRPENLSTYCVLPTYLRWQLGISSTMPGNYLHSFSERACE
jgi:hypothetical protein